MSGDLLPVITFNLDVQRNELLTNKTNLITFYGLLNYIITFLTLK